MSASTSNRRASRTISRRQASRIVLTCGIALAVAAAFGNVWLARVGILIAILAGAVALWLAGRELARARSQHNRELAETARSHNESLREERRRTGQVLDRLRAHNDKADSEIGTLHTQIGELRRELSTLHGNNAALRVNLLQRNRRIEELQQELARREAELQALHTSDDAEVVALPRNAVSVNRLPSADDVWADGDHPTVVDLQRLAFPEQTEERKQA